MRNPSLTGLTGEEKKLLSALVHFPNETDRRLGEMSGLEAPRAIYIRSRMQKLGIFQYLRVPDFSRLGAGFFWAGVLETGAGGDEGAALGRLRPMLGGMANLFWAFGGAGLAVVMGLYRSHEEVAADIAALERVPGVRVAGSVELPAAALEKGNFLDFSRVLERPAGNWGAGAENAAGAAAGRFRPLLRFEKEALQALVDFPDDGYTALARRLGLELRVFLERTGEVQRERLYRTVAVPDIRLLGMEALAVWMTTGGEAKTLAEETVPGQPAPAVEAAPQEAEVPRDGPIRDADTGEPLPMDTGMVAEQDSVLPDGLPAGLKDDWVSDSARDKRERAEARSRKRAGAKAGRNDGAGQAPAGAEGRDGAGKAPAAAGDLKMPWQVAPMARPSRPRYDGPRPWETGPSGGKRGIEALPKDIARTLIGRPSRETVEQARNELERRRIWDIDLDRILQDAGVVPAKRTAPSAPPLPPVWVKLASGARMASPADGVQGSAMNAGGWGARASAGFGENKAIAGNGGDLTMPGAAAATVTISSPAGLVMTVAVKRKRGRPPKVRPAPVETGAAALDTSPVAVLADGGIDAPAPVVKRKRGRPRKNPVNGNVAMAMERFSARVEDEKGPVGQKARPDSAQAAMPVLLDAREAGRRFMLGLFRERSDVDRADERLNDELGAGLELHLMPVAQLEILKPLDFGAVTRRILELD